MSIPLHWWYIPVCLAILGLVFCERGCRSDGFFDGLFLFVFGCVVVIAALVWLLMGWLV